MNQMDNNCRSTTIHFLSVLVLVIFMNPTKTNAQSRIGFFLSPELDRVAIPFEKYSNLIVVPVKINNSLELKFIVDTGAESSILTEKIYGDILRLHYVREISINGPGVIDSVKAYVASNVQMSLGEGKIVGNGLNILVLENDYLELNKNLGEEIYGIIGYDLFQRFVVEIDYDNNQLIIIDPAKFHPGKRFTEIPIEVSMTKPYMHAIVHQGEISDTVRLMIDTGASHAALLDVTATDHLVMPDELIRTRLGQGLGGEIPGFIGRLDKFEIQEFEFEKVLISVPKPGAYVKAIKRGSRHGTVGGDLLSRFHVVFDYQNEKLYLKKGGYYNDTFEYNMSGMTVISDGEDLKDIIVTSVSEDTPAFEAGVLANDNILKINGRTLRNSNISEIHSLLRYGAGKKIKLIILREGVKMKKEFRLKKLI
jgi:hypothetical protein